MQTGCKYTENKIYKYILYKLCIYIFSNIDLDQSKVAGVSMSASVTSNQPSLHVTWSAPSSDHPIQHYQVDYRVGTSGSWSRLSPNPTSTSVTLTGLQSGTSYQVRVRAVSDVENGEWSDAVSETTYVGTYIYTCTWTLLCLKS